MPLSFLFACSTGWLFPCLPRGLFPCLQQGLFPCLLPDGAPFRQIAFLAGASCRARFPRSSMAPPASNSAKVPLPAALPDGSLPQCRHPLRHGTPGLQRLPDGSSLQRPCRQSSVPTVPCLQQLRHSASASNKPHPAVLCADGPLPATASPQRLCWQQTSSGGEEYSGLASNLAHLGRIC